MRESIQVLVLSPKQPLTVPDDRRGKRSNLNPTLNGDSPRTHNRGILIRDHRYEAGSSVRNSTADSGT